MGHIWSDNTVLAVLHLRLISMYGVANEFQLLVVCKVALLLVPQDRTVAEVVMRTAEVYGLTHLAGDEPFLLGHRNPATETCKETHVVHTTSPCFSWLRQPSWTCNNINISFD